MATATYSIYISEASGEKVNLFQPSGLSMAVDPTLSLVEQLYFLAIGFCIVHL